MGDHEAEQAELLEMLNQGLQQQRRAVRCFELLQAAARPEDKSQLTAMQREDRRHYYLLEGIFEEILGRAYLPPRLAVAMPRQYVAMLQVMIRYKLDTVSLFEKIADALDCLKQKELMAIVIGDQKEQSRILAEIYKSSL